MLTTNTKSLVAQGFLSASAFICSRLAILKGPIPIAKSIDDALVAPNDPDPLYFALPVIGDDDVSLLDVMDKHLDGTRGV